MKNIKIENVCMNDYPDFCDAFISYAEHENGNPLTEEELEKANEVEGNLIHELAHESLEGME